MKLRYKLDNYYIEKKKTPSVRSKATQLTRLIGRDAEYEQKISQLSQGGTEIWVGHINMLT